MRILATLGSPLGPQVAQDCSGAPFGCYSAWFLIASRARVPRCFVTPRVLLFCEFGVFGCRAALEDFCRCRIVVFEVVGDLHLLRLVTLLSVLQPCFVLETRPQNADLEVVMVTPA